MIYRKQKSLRRIRGNQREHFILRPDCVLYLIAKVKDVTCPFDCEDPVLGIGQNPKDLLF